jgi:YegS/Rv2252/BmrU family lipid kinase
MKHLFIINPRAGKKTSEPRLMDQIGKLRQAHNLDCEIVLTARAGDAENATRRAVESGGDWRIYACGGDGTLNEVANGAAGAEHIEVTMVPVGTGNDFMRNFGDAHDRFLDLEQLWNGPSSPLDLIECNGRVALTIVCAGLDARIAYDVHKYSKYPAVTGEGAYLASVCINFFKQISNRIIITCGGKTTIGEYAMICVCNGRYYGGGFMPVADARMDDGVLDTLIVRQISRPTFVRIVADYAKGRAWKHPDIIRRVDYDAIHLQSREPIAVSLDGEIVHIKDADIRLSEKKLRFFAPAGASCNRTATERRIADNRGEETG